MLSNFRKNIMGTVSFDGQFPGMRKAQEFIVYPMTGSETHIRAQSNKKMMRISLRDGAVLAYPGKYSLGRPTTIHALCAADLLLLKSNIMSTADGKAGTNGVMWCDNSGALEVFS